MGKAPSEKPEVTKNTTEEAFPMTGFFAFSALTIAFIILLVRKSRSAIAPLLLVAMLPLAGCVSVSRLATMEDVDEVRESIATAAESQRDAYEAALAEGKSPSEATVAAFSANVKVQREAQATAKEAGGESNWPLWAELLAVILGGGTAGTILTRIVRGAPLRSGSGAAKAAKAATTA